MFLISYLNTFPFDKKKFHTRAFYVSSFFNVWLYLAIQSNVTLSPYSNHYVILCIKEIFCSVHPIALYEYISRRWLSIDECCASFGTIILIILILDHKNIFAALKKKITPNGLSRSSAVDEKRKETVHQSHSYYDWKKLYCRRENKYFRET